MTHELIFASALVVAGFVSGVHYTSRVSPSLPAVTARVNDFAEQISQLEQALRASCPLLRGPYGQNSS